MKATRVTIVRHGETEWNKRMLLQGHKDSPLTKSGVEQAEQLAETIHNREFDILLTSDLGRTRHTTEIVNKHLGLKPIEEKSLRERAYGIMEGLTRDEVKNNFREVYDAYMNRDHTYAIPCGESLVDFNRRVIEGIDAIIRAYKGKNILIVAHGGVLDCVIRKIFDIELFSERTFTIFNTSVNTFSVQGDKWVLEEWGNIEHLNKSVVLDELK